MLLQKPQRKDGKNCESEADIFKDAEHLCILKCLVKA